MRLAASVILYHPEPDFLNHLETYVHEVDLLLVIDNSETPDDQLLKQISLYPQVKLFSFSENIGIANALNHASSIAVEEGFDWLLTMDQDSYFEKDSFRQYRTCLAQLELANQIGMVGVNYIDQESSDQPCELSDVETLITSGSVLNLSILRALNGFDERLFIDEVDSEYCYRLRKHRYRVCRFNSIYMAHQLGTSIQVRNWLIGPTVMRNIHSPVRIYYMVRNFLLIYRLYRKEFKPELRNNARILANRIKNALLYSRGNRFRVAYFIFKGVKDFLSANYGKLN